MEFNSFIFILILLTVGYIIGSITERRHYSSIIKREKEFLRLAAITIKNPHQDSQVDKAMMVTGSVVISNDHFKRLLARLRNIFGGRVKSYESLVDRSRREAVLRMKEQAPDADIIVNMRLETSTIGKSANKKRNVGSIETLAYGTAIYLIK